MLQRSRNFTKARFTAAALALAILANGSMALSTARAAAVVGASQPTITSVVPGNHVLTVNWAAAAADRGHIAGYKVTATSPSGVVSTSCARAGTPVSGLTASYGTFVKGRSQFGN